MYERNCSCDTIKFRAVTLDAHVQGSGEHCTPGPVELRQTRCACCYITRLCKNIACLHCLHCWHGSRAARNMHFPTSWHAQHQLTSHNSRRSIHLTQQPPIKPVILQASALMLFLPVLPRCPQDPFAALSTRAGLMRQARRLGVPAKAFARAGEAFDAADLGGCAAWCAPASR